MKQRRIPTGVSAEMGSATGVHYCCKILVVAALLAPGSLLRAVPFIPNPSFEANTFTQAPGFVANNTAISGWTASDPARIGLNPTAGDETFADNGIVPQGTRVAFIQSVNFTATKLSTTMSSLVAGRHYRLTFRYNRMGNAPTVEASYRVNGGPAVHLGFVVPVDPVGTHAAPYYQATAFFVATGATAPLEITNASGPASALLVDDFRIVEATTLQVTNPGDTGSGSLRQTLVTAASTPGFQVITFAPALSGAVIALASTIVVNDPEGVAIDASALPKSVNISGGAIGFRLFDVQGPVHFRGLMLSGGRGDGGAILCNANLPVKIMIQMTRCTLFQNGFTGFGGAIDMIYGTLVLQQCTLGQNVCGAEGGAILLNTGTVAALQHTTICQNNVSQYGGGISNHGVLTLTNTILSGNGGPNGADLANFGGPPPNGRVIAINSNVVFIVYNNGGSLEGSPPIPAPAALAQLADNGGPLLTMAETLNSPSRNASTGSTVTTDQRGRPVRGVADIGAYEVQAGTLSISNPLALNEKPPPQKATLTITRTDGFDGAVSVKVYTFAGTAGAADYTGMFAKDFPFADKDLTKDIDIPITDDSLAEANEYFTVVLSGPTGGALLGSRTSTTVTIVDDSSKQGEDTTPPFTPVIATPVAGATLNFDGTFVVTGSVSDNKGAAGVIVHAVDSVGSTEVTVPQFSMPPFAASGTWSVTVTAPFTSSAVNIDVVSQDVATNSSLLAARRTVNLLHPLRVDIVGNGSVTPGFAPKSYRKVGIYHTITATPAAGQLFTGWTLRNATNADIGVPAVALERQTLTFIHRAGLELVANFVPTPFTPSLTGNYNGLIRPGGGGGGLAVWTGHNLGFASATVMANGAFSGSLLLEGFALNFSGVLDHTGVARFGVSRNTFLIVPRLNSPSVRLKSLRMRNSAGLQPILDGDIEVLDTDNDVLLSLTFVANRAAFNGTTAPAPVDLLGPNSANATYSVVFGAASGQAFVEPYQFPQGHGYARLTVTKAGIVTLTDGAMADGTVGFSASTFLDQNLRASLFFQLYNKKGFFFADMGFNVTAESDVAATGYWARPVIPTSQYYPGGWPLLVVTQVFGAKYVVPTGASVITGPNGAPLTSVDADGNADVVFSSGQLSETLTKHLNVSPSDIVTKVPVNDPTCVFFLNRTTGLFSGNFEHTDLTRPSYRGILYQRGTRSGGWGFFLTTPTVPLDYLGESGAVKVLGR